MSPVPQDEMECKLLVEAVTAYLEHALPDDERARFEQHLAECPPCVTYVDQMRITVETLGRLSDKKVPAENCDELLRIFREYRPG